MEMQSELELVAPDHTTGNVASQPVKLTAPIDCDLIAPWYEPVEHLCFGGALERRRKAFLGVLSDVETVISCGEGDGRFSAALLVTNPHVKVTAIDVSWKMTQIGSKRVTRMGEPYRRRFDYVCAEIGTFAPPEPADLIATHFFLDCFSTDQVRPVVERLANWAKPRSRWIVSEFAQPPSSFARLWTGAVIRSLYAAFRVTTGLRVTDLPDYRRALRREGFRLLRQEHALDGLLVSELWERS